MKFMKFLLLLVVSTTIVVSSLWAEYYKVNVKRIDKDLYKDEISRVYIQTKFCYEYAYGEEAVLKYEPYAYDNKLIFDSGTSCDVEKVFK